MQRREAIRVFREICKCMPDMFISSVSLIPNNRFKKDFDLRIYASFDLVSVKNVQSVSQKHGMNVIEEQGSLLIRDQAEQVEIAAWERRSFTRGVPKNSGMYAQLISSKRFIANAAEEVGVEARFIVRVCLVFWSRLYFCSVP